MDNSKGIDHAERSINNLRKALNVVTRKVKANRKTASGNEESIKEMNKEMTYVKTQVVEFCGYQSSWGKEVASIHFINRPIMMISPFQLPSPESNIVHHVPGQVCHL